MLEEITFHLLVYRKQKSQALNLALYIFNLKLNGYYFNLLLLLQSESILKKFRDW
jgi:hypothetical protein